MQRTLTPADITEKLRRLPGIVYELDDDRTEEVPPNADDPAAHTLYVIRKLRRMPAETADKAPRETTLRYYYCLDGVVYEAPSLAAVLRTRLLRVSWHLQAAFKTARDADRAQHFDREREAEPNPSKKVPLPDRGREREHDAADREPSGLASRKRPRT